MEAVEKQCMKVYDEEYMSGKVSGVIKKYVASLALHLHADRLSDIYPTCGAFCST